MPSKPETIEKAAKARTLKEQGLNDDQVAATLSISKALVKEYLERNSHGPSCSICHGYGVSKDRATGTKRPICSRD